MKITDDFFFSFSEKGLKTLFVVDVSDTIRFNFHRDKYKLNSPIVWDKDHLIRKKSITNEESTCFLLNNLGQIILSGDFVTNTKIKNTYYRMITEL